MMLFNYFAWVRQAPANELRLLVDVPDALIGDCYYLQNLVTAIVVQEPVHDLLLPRTSPVCPTTSRSTWAVNRTVLSLPAEHAE